jgi:hypothetical protein
MVEYWTRLDNQHLSFILKGLDFMKQKPYARLTVDMSIDEHTCVKMASAQLGISMREFVLLATFEKMEAIDDQWLSDQAGKTRKRLELKYPDFNPS